MTALPVAVAWDVQRVIGLAAAVMTVPLLGLAILTCRRPTPVRIRLDVARLVVSGGAILLMAQITQVSTEGGLITVAVGAGVLVGIGQGWMTNPQLDNGRILVRKSATGIAAWGLGVLAMQVAGILARTGTLRLGQTISLFGVGVLAGTIVGRQSRLRRPSSGGGLRPVAFLLIVVGIAIVVAGPGRGRAQAAGNRPPAEDVCALAAEGAFFTFPRYFGGTSVQDGPTPACIVRYVPTGNHDFGVYSFMVFWYQEPFDTDAAAEARATAEIDRSRPGDDHNSRVDVVDLPLGEYGYSATQTHSTVGVPDVQEEVVWTSYSVQFGRGPFLVSGGTSDEYPGTMSELLRLAAEFDENIAAKLAAMKVTPPETTGSSPTVSTSVSPSTLAPAIGAEPPGDQFAPDFGDSPQPDERIPTDRAPDISSAAAVGQALGGLLAAVGMGLISAADAGVLSSSLVGRGPLSPGKAIEIINELLSGRSGMFGSPTNGTAASGGPSPPPPAPPPPAPPSRVRTVQISGAAAEAVIKAGPGSTVPIPTDQQWDSNVSIPGDPPITGGRVGSVGVVRSVGPIARGPGGRVTVSVDVNAFDPTAPPPPPPPAETPPDLPPDASPPPLPTEPPPPPPPQLEAPPPFDAPPDLSPPPPPSDIPPDAPPDIPPDTPPNIPPDAPPDAPPDTPTNIPPDVPPDAPPDVPPDAPPDVPPDVPVSGVVLDEQEITDIVRWGVERNRSPEDIRQDLDWLNRGRGGSGPVELPGSPVRVDTDAGPVTLMADDAAEFERAVAERERLQSHREYVRDRMAKLEQQAARWGRIERLTEWRAAAGIADIADQLQGPGGLSNIAKYSEHLTEGEFRLGLARGALRGIEQGTSAPIRELFDMYPDPDEEYARALEDWRTRDTKGRYFEEAARLRAEIAGRVSGTHVPEVKPARSGDRGTIFDRPARELARIAEEQDRMLRYYRGFDQRLEAAQRVIDDVTDRARPN